MKFVYEHKMISSTVFGIHIHYYDLLIMSRSAQRAPEIIISFCSSTPNNPQKTVCENQNDRGQNRFQKIFNISQERTKRFPKSTC